MDGNRFGGSPVEGFGVNSFEICSVTEELVNILVMPVSIATSLESMK
jgi:hypothetical protein